MRKKNIETTNNNKMAKEALLFLVVLPKLRQKANVRLSVVHRVYECG
jgi:hypothetical protein